MPAEVTAVVGNYEGEDVLIECIESLRRQTVELAEVIVVDAESTDSSVAVAERLGARVLLAPNNGLGSLYNRGVEHAQTEFVLLLNNDVSLDERCVELLADALRPPDRFAADPRQMSWSGDRVVHARATLRHGRLFRELMPGLHLDMLVPADEIVPTVSANGGAMLVRREMFRELGGFDETFFMDFEDLDLCWRAWLRGWASVYVPDAWLRHKVGAVTTADVRPRRIASSHHNLTRFALKGLPARAAATVVAGELLRLPAHPRAIAAGLAQVVREIPEILQLRRSLAPARTLFAWATDGQVGPVPKGGRQGGRTR